MASVVVKCKDGPMPHPSVAFQLKCEREIDKLNGRLRKRLQNDMLNLFQEKSFADVSFITEDLSEIPAHSCLLRARVANFYNLYVKKRLHCQIPVRIELYQLNTQQLQHFLRSVYCGEDVSEEESSILQTLKSVELDFTKISKDTFSSHTFLNNMEIGRQDFFALDNGSETSSSRDRTEQQLLGSLDNEGNELEFCSSLSEGLQCSETFTDLTDQFSTSASDVVGVLTLNANDDVMDATSLISVEELNGSEASCGVEITVDRKITQDVIYDSKVVTRRPVLSSAKVEVDEVCRDGDVFLDFCSISDTKSLAVEDPICVDVQSSETVVSESALSASEARLTIRRGTFELEVTELADFSGNNAMESDISQDKLTVDECFANEAQHAVDVPVMLCSHESRDADSGVCSMVRKLSTSSSFGHKSNCSDRAPDSPPESLPKDDSLEFCPDSLASEDAHLAIFSGGPSDSGFSGMDTSQGDFHKSSLRKSLPPSLDKEFIAESSQSGTTARKDAWASEVREVCSNDIEPRRWSYSCGEVYLKSMSKPSAIVPPYNALEDAKLPQKTVLVKDTSNDIQSPSSVHPERHKTEKQMAPCSIQLDFVPFLKEERTTSHIGTFADGKGHLHHTVLASPTQGPKVASGVDIEPLLFSTKEKEVVTMESDNNLLDLDVHRPIIFSESEEMKRSLDIESRPVLSGFSDGIPAVCDEGSKTAKRSAGDESHSLKPEGLFMFIDLNTLQTENDTQSDVKMHVETVAQSLESPKKTQAEGFYFIPADVEPSCSSENKTSLDDDPVSKVSVPQSIYMFIDTGPTPVAECSSPSVRHPKLTERKVPVLRRIRAGSSASPNRRPKSESAVSLLANAADTGSADRTGKRVSLTFGEESDEVTYSIESSVKGDAKLQRKSCSRLGGDLLRMFLDEINPDVVIRVGEKDIKAHKSILTSRCVYFAAMLSGGWVESAGNVIKLQGFSYEAVHFALSHIYGGAASVPESIDISELASLADMLGLEGLKEVVMLALKMKMCHFFHKPCTTCATSVSECLLIAASFGLDEVQEKCLKWITKYMLKTWPTKAFAALPDEILQKCFLSAKMEITPDTVLDTLLCCDKLMATLPHVKWTEPVFSLTSRLADTASSFLSANFADVLTSSSFLSLRTGQSWSIHALESTFLLAVEKLPLDGACHAYVRLQSFLDMSSPIDYLENSDINENFVALLTKIHRQVEHFLIHNANRVVRCSGWNRLSPDLQKKIKDAAVIVFEFGKPTAAPPRLSSLNRKFTRTRASNSTSSASPTIERARVPTCTSGPTRSAQKNVGIHKADKKEAKNDTKAATLPRTTCKALSDSKVHEGSLHTGAAASLGSVRSSGKGHTNSCTMPMTKTTELKKMDSSTNRPSQSGNQCSLGTKSGILQKNMATGISTANTSYASGASRPKSWPVRERHTTLVTETRVREKTPGRELPKEERFFASNSSFVLKSAVRVSNGSTKISSPALNAKMLVCNGSNSCNSSNGRISKQVIGSPALNVRDSRASSLRKAASSDLQGKESRDDLRKRIATRPRSDDVSASASRRPGQRVPLNSKSTRMTNK